MGNLKRLTFSLEKTKLKIKNMIQQVKISEEEVAYTKIPLKVILYSSSSFAFSPYFQKRSRVQCRSVNSPVLKKLKTHFQSQEKSLIQKSI